MWRLPASSRERRVRHGRGGPRASQVRFRSASVVPCGPVPETAAGRMRGRLGDLLSRVVRLQRRRMAGCGRRRERRAVPFLLSISARQQSSRLSSVSLGRGTAGELAGELRVDGIVRGTSGIDEQRADRRQDIAKVLIHQYLFTALGPGRGGSGWVSRGSGGGTRRVLGPVCGRCG
jgi:hypothetical protein